MLMWKWEGRPRDYALIVALVGFQAAISAVFADSIESWSLAYIDPGVGAMIVQAIAAAFFGALFYFKNLRKALGRFFMKLAGKAPVLLAPRTAAGATSDEPGRSSRPAQVTAEVPPEKK